MARQRLVLVVIVVGLVIGCGLMFYFRHSIGRLAFARAIRGSDEVVLYEGLPHDYFERELLAQEIQSKATLKLAGFDFYRETLELNAADAGRLATLLSDSATYEPLRAPKLCGGFHPDYAVEWRVGADRYQAILCFGCGEVELNGPRIRSRFDIRHAVGEELRQLLGGYHRNRPGERTEFVN